MSVTSSVLSGGAERSGSTRYLPIAAPRTAVPAVATITTAASWSHAESIPAARAPMNVASPAKAPTMSTSPWENLITSSTPKNTVNPTATMAYITPSIRPLATYWPRTLGSIQRPLHVKPSAARISDGTLCQRRSFGLRPRDVPVLSQPPLARRILALLPHDPFAVLHDVLCDERHDVLPVVIEGDLADDRVLVFGLVQLGGHALAVGPHLFDHVHDQVCRSESERSVGFRPLVVLGLRILAGEVQPAGELLPRRALDEGERAFGELPAEALDVGIGLDAGGSFEDRVDAELLHLRADAHADRREAPEIDHVGLELLGLGQLGGEVLLVRGDAEPAGDLAPELRQVLGEVLVVALTVVGGVVNDHPALEFHAGHELRRHLVLVDHGAVDAVHLRVLVAVGDVGQHRAPHHHREAELVIGVYRRDGGHRAVVRDARDDGVVGSRLGRRAHGGIRLALVVEAHQLEAVFRLGVLVAQAHRKIGGIAPADAVRRHAARQRPDVDDLHRLLLGA